MDQRGFAPNVTLLVFLGIIVIMVGVGVRYLSSKKVQPQLVTPDTQTTTPPPTVSSTPPASTSTPIINGNAVLSMVVSVKEDDDFIKLAQYFAEKKKARLVIFNNLGDLVNQLKTLRPSYLTLVSSPQGLTPDFIDELDMAVRQIDADLYFDVAYGIITSFNEREGFEYVDRLLAYKPVSSPSIYGVNQFPKIRWLGSIYGFDFQDRCVGGYGFSICNEEHEATVDRLTRELSGKDVVNIGLHGSPTNMSLGNGESIVGNIEGLMGLMPTGETECKQDGGGTGTCGPKMKLQKLNLNAALLTAYSCTTARINGKPSIVKREFDDTEEEGKIESSVVLSALKSGALDYIGSTHVANSAIFPLETLSEEAVLQGIPVGLALKDFKNNYVFNRIFQERSFPGKPIGSQFTRDFIEFQLKNWVLFGDPSLRLTSTKKVPQNCIQGYTERTVSGGKEVAVRIEFSDAGGRELNNTQLLNLLNDDTSSASGNSACAIHIPIEKMTDLQIKTEGINSRFETMFVKTNGIIENLGDELLMIIPDFVLEGGMSGRANVTLLIKK